MQEKRRCCTPPKAKIDLSPTTASKHLRYGYPPLQLGEYCRRPGPCTPTLPDCSHSRSFLPVGWLPLAACRRRGRAVGRARVAVRRAQGSLLAAGELHAPPRAGRFAGQPPPILRLRRAQRLETPFFFTNRAICGRSQHEKQSAQRARATPHCCRARRSRWLEFNKQNLSGLIQQAAVVPWCPVYNFAMHVAHEKVNLAKMRNAE